MNPLRTLHPREARTVLAAGLTHWLQIAPDARSELRGWSRLARSTPDPTLRRHALKKLTREALNPEAAAFFAILAPRTNRHRLVRLIVAYQVAYDYLDAINEQPDALRLCNGLQLHRVLVHAVRLAPASANYYEHHPQHEDGGYLDTLKRTCRDALVPLPSTSALAPQLVLAAERCGEAQARNHAVTVDGRNQLIHWSRRQAQRSEYLWWELAAAGISCLGIHALFAAAATPRMTMREARLIDAAYFPPVCAISALLDSLIDLPHDAGTINHSFADHYTSSNLLAERYTTIINSAQKLLSELHLGLRHRVILAGITGYYLSAAEATTDFALPAKAQALNALGPLIRPILVAMRIRRRRHGAILSKAISHSGVAGD